MEVITPPRGYRRLQMEDVVIGKDVLYVGRTDPSSPFQTKIVDPTIKADNKIALDCKSEAGMERIFIADEGAAVEAAVGAESSQPNEAAAGAVVQQQQLTRTPQQDADEFLQQDADDFLKLVAAWLYSIASRIPPDHPSVVAWSLVAYIFL